MNPILIQLLSSEVQSMILKTSPNVDNSKLVKMLGGRKMIFGYLIIFLGIMFNIFSLGDPDFAASLLFSGIGVAMGGNISDYVAALSRTKTVINSPFVESLVKAGGAFATAPEKVSEFPEDDQKKTEEIQGIVNETVMKSLEEWGKDQIESQTKKLDEKLVKIIEAKLLEKLS